MFLPVYKHWLLIKGTILFLRHNPEKQQLFCSHDGTYTVTYLVLEFNFKALVNNLDSDHAIYKMYIYIKETIEKIIKPQIMCENLIFLRKKQRKIQYIKQQQKLKF